MDKDPFSKSEVDRNNCRTGRGGRASLHKRSNLELGSKLPTIYVPTRLCTVPAESHLLKPAFRPTKELQPLSPA